MLETKFNCKFLPNFHAPGSGSEFPIRTCTRYRGLLFCIPVLYVKMLILNTDKSTCTHCMYAPTKHYSIYTLLNTTVSTRFRFVALLCQNLSIMGETEKAAAEAAVVPPPQQPAALPLGPQPGVKYPIQESHFVISRPCCKSTDLDPPESEKVEAIEDHLEHWIWRAQIWDEVSIRTRIRIRIKLKGRIRFRIRAKGRIRIRINMWIRNAGSNLDLHLKIELN